MANEDSVLREVDQELAEDRQWSMFRKYGPAVIGAASALVIGVGAWQFYNAAKDRAAAAQAASFSEAVDTLVENPAAGREALSAISEDGAGGYAVLAQFRRAASLASEGDNAAAVAAFKDLYSDNGAPKALRNLARLRAAYLSLDEGRDAALSHLGPLSESDGPYRLHADEIAAVAALRAEDYETALSLFNKIAASPNAPITLSTRAEEYAALAVAGKGGVNLTGEIRLDDIVGAVGEAPAQTPGDAAQEETDEPATDGLAEDAAGENADEDSAAEAGNE